MASAMHCSAGGGKDSRMRSESEAGGRKADGFYHDRTLSPSGVCHASVARSDSGNRWMWASMMGISDPMVAIERGGGGGNGWECGGDMCFHDV